MKKNAAYDRVMKNFQDELFSSKNTEETWNSLVKNASHLKKEAKLDPGSKLALDEISNFDNKEFGYYSFLKFSQQLPPEELVGLEFPNKEFQEGFEQAVRDSTEVSEFELGKYAALVDFATMSNQDFEMIIDQIEGTFNGLNKTASKEANAFQSGVENICYNFMKLATEAFVYNENLDSLLETLIHDESDLLERLGINPDTASSELSRTSMAKNASMPNEYGGIGSWFVSNRNKDVDTNTDDSVDTEYTFEKEASMLEAIRELQKLNLGD